MRSPESPPLRVLHVHSGNLWGGVETMLLTLARHERRVSTMTSEFALCFDGRVADRLRDAAASVSMLAPVRFSQPGSVARARRALAERLAATKASVAVVHSSWIAALFGDLIASSGLGRALWVHAPDRGPLWQRWPAERFRPHVAICNSRYTASAMPATDATVEVCRYPVDLDDRRATRTAVRSDLGVGGDAVVVAIAARLEPWKGHQSFVEALGRLRDVQGWTGWVIGGAQNAAEASYERALGESARALGIEHRLHWLGQREDVPSLLSAADIYCQPNHGPEPFGISFIEGLAAGLPVVTTSIGAAPEIVDDTCGMLVPPQDPDRLASVLEGLIVDGGRRRTLAEAGPARAAELCAPERQIPSLQRLLALAATKLPQASHA